MDVVFRGIERHELAGAVALITEGSLSPGTEALESLDDYWEAVQLTRARDGEVLVGVYGNDVVAMCQVIIFRHFQHSAGWCCEIESVYVASKYRGQGIGSALLRRVEDFARFRGCYRLQLASRNERLDAHSFYRSSGFSQSSQGFKKQLLD